jgi:DNA invertase Pin-like site-specific DNA recombinase
MPRDATRGRFHVIGAFAENDKDTIRSRFNAGLARARARGVRLDRRKTSGRVERNQDTSSGGDPS